jgi:adenine-specific DNA glycosylase
MPPSTAGGTPAATIFASAKQTLDFTPKKLTPLCTVKHSITRYRITLEAFRVQIGGSRSARPKESGMGRHGTPPSDRNGIWLPLAKLDSLALTSAHRKILERLKSKLTSPASPAAT